MSTGTQPGRDPAAALLAATEMAELRHDLWWAIWRRAAAAGVDPSTDPATQTGEAAQAAALLELSIAETAAAYVAMSTLPTREEMFARADDALDTAYRAFGDAADWLRSDWSPVGSSLTDAQAKRRTRMFKQIEAAKTAINQAKD